MPEKQNYNTKARKYILDYLSKIKDSTVSAADIVKGINENENLINQATVYRYLNKLTEEKKLLKFTDEETQKSVYRLALTNGDCDGHLHIKCTECGKVFHLECEFMEEIKTHLFNDHNFALKCDRSILYGVCDKCR